MIKRHLLPVLVVAGLASVAWGTVAPASECQARGGCCFWAADNCHSYSTPDYTGADALDRTACESKSGIHVMDCANSGVSSYNCDWGECTGGDGWNCTTGGCYAKTGDQTEECTSKSGTVVATCPESHKPPAAKGSSGSGGGTSSGGGGGTSSGGGGGTSSGGGGNTPVLNIQPIIGLTVVPHGRALHISSPKDARVTLYDLSGNKVFGGTVRAGNSVFSLASQAPGVYYAVVQVGSLTQTVNVVLMK